VCTEDTNEEMIFDAVARLSSHAERDAYLSEACGGDRKLRAAVEELLKHHGVSSFLDVAPVDSGVALDDSPISEGPGTVIGRYRLLERIGEGGMAVVYMAEQAEPIRRKVALKIIKLGMDTKQVIARFEAERQALAMMDHPHIAKVLDAGATETGRPYFVMELVRGVSITEYCDKNSLRTKDRLKLFIQVCNAVQHAHQKGIIHRDLKPSNVMVAQRDGVPVPKVIDFGIAKATNQRLTEKTLFTRYAHLIGTPAYMSPEQAELSDLDVDTRTDIYSLGVLLYELLTGATPFGEEELRKAGYLEMQRIIRDEEPTKPSTKLSTLGETLTDIAKHRSSTPDLLRKAIRGDLDWIVMKALEKDRNRRYDNASALAMDVRRHLCDEPVAARAPSIVYRLKKFVKRRRIQVAAALAVVLLCLSLALLAIVWMTDRLRLAEAEASRHRDILTQARMLLGNGDAAGATETLTHILDSKHVGSQARRLRATIVGEVKDINEALAQVDNHWADYYRERVNHYSRQIQLSPADANNYLQRAHYYFALRDHTRTRADMKAYSSILNPPGRRLSDQGRPRMVSDPEKLLGLSFGIPANLGPIVNSSSLEGIFAISHDGLELYLTSDRPGGQGAYDIWVSRRDENESDWGVPVNLGPRINTAFVECAPTISHDGLELYFASYRPGGQGDGDLWVSRRSTTSEAWRTPVNLGPAVNTEASEVFSGMSGDGLRLYFSEWHIPRIGGHGREDLWLTVRVSTSEAWERPVNLGATLNSGGNEACPWVSPDGLCLFFTSDRPGGHGGEDVWVTTRAATSDPWGHPFNLGSPVNSPSWEAGAQLSPDGSSLYFISTRPGGFGNHDLWRVPIFRIQDDAAAERSSDKAKMLRGDAGYEGGGGRNARVE